MSLFARLNEYGRRRIIQVLGALGLVVALYLLGAGRFDVPWLWVYAALGLISAILGGAYVLLHNPEAINERGRPAEKQPGWDRALVAVYGLLSIGIYFVAGLDVRFGWSQVATWLHVLGLVLLPFATALTYAAMAHNKFLSVYVQVSQERGHQVASGGPYRYVRHPMYVSLVLTWPGVGLLLGSWPAFWMGLLAAMIIILRTALEDRKLQMELPGYAEYAREVRYRLLPGVW